MDRTHFSKKPKVFYGYWIVLVAFLCCFIQSGVAFFAFSLFVKPLEADFGWGRGEIMVAFTILFLIMAITSPFIGRIVDRYGSKQVISIGALIAGLGFVFLTQINSLWHFYLGYVIIGTGISAMGQVPASAVVTNWFQKKRGLAIGIMSIGIGGGGFVTTPLLGSYLIPNFGWRASYLALAILTWVLIIPLAILVMKTKPADMGLYPDGTEAPEVMKVTQASPLDSSGLTPRMALATPAFWLIAVSFLLILFGQAGIMQSQVPHLNDIGFPMSTATAALGLVALMSAIGKFGSGWLCDRIPPKYVCAIGISLQIGGITMLINVQSASPSTLIWLYAILMGLGAGSWLPTMSMLTSTSFGLAYYGAIFGMVSLAQNIGVAAGPLMAGFMYDITNTYHWAFTIFLILFALTLPAILVLRRPKAV